MEVSDRTEENFGHAEMQLLSFEDLYAGKICAALDRLGKMADDKHQAALNRLKDVLESFK